MPGFNYKSSSRRPAHGQSSPQADLAARVGRPQSFVAKYERGERRLDVVEFARSHPGNRLSHPRSHADWAIFMKNGTDATTLALTIAGAATGKKKILVATGAYHGAAPWCTPNTFGVPEAERVNLIYYKYNDIGSVDQAAAAAGNDFAGLIVSPFRHDAGFDQELVDPEFARHVRSICDRAGSALILDDVRCGLRLAFGGSWEPIGARPDLSAWSKAIANGYPLAALLGSGSLREVFESFRHWVILVFRRANGSLPGYARSP